MLRHLMFGLLAFALACSTSGKLRITLGATDAGVGDAGLGDAGPPGQIDAGDAGTLDAGQSAADAGVDAGADAGDAGPDGGPDAGFTVGDRNLGLTVEYPPAAFLQNGGCIIDLRNPPPDAGIRPAMGDGHTDDTQAFFDVYDFIKNTFIDAGSFPAACNWVYLRNGTYLVSDTLMYRGQTLEPLTGYDWDDIVGVRFIGESRAGSTIQLADNAPGFQDAGAPKIVLAYQHPDTRFNNIPAGNALDNLTIDVGKGNPGAIGVFFQGANTTEMWNVRITSDDGTGAYGLWFNIGSLQGAYHDLTIEGFMDGVHQDSNSETDEALEHVTLRGQAHAGAAALGGGMTLRDAWIDETATDAGAIFIDQNGGQVAVIDSLLAGASRGPAIELTDAGDHYLFARNVAVQGYGVGIDQAGVTEAAGNVAEYVSAPVITLFPGQPTTSLNLPALDAPLVPWFDAGTQWANVDDFGAIGDGGVDDTTAVQKALSSGLPVIYFPRQDYLITKTLTVPASVQRVEAFDANLHNATFQVSEASTTPILLRDLGGYGRVQATVSRDVVLQLSSQGFENSNNSPLNLFIENCANIGGGFAFTPSAQHTYARSLNDENGGSPNDAGFNPVTDAADIEVQGGFLWLLNYKTENKHIPVLSALPGSVVEVLGGYVNVTEPPLAMPMIVNTGANVSYLGFSNLFCGELEAFLQETRGDTTAQGLPATLPPRGFSSCYTVPLYVGYDAGATP